MKQAAKPDTFKHLTDQRLPNGAADAVTRHSQNVANEQSLKKKKLKDALIRAKSDEISAVNKQNRIMKLLT